MKWLGRKLIGWAITFFLMFPIIDYLNIKKGFGGYTIGIKGWFTIHPLPKYYGYTQVVKKLTPNGDPLVGTRWAREYKRNENILN